MSEGYVFMTAPCLICGVPFTFNPHKVPSHRPASEKEREPICRGCFDEVNDLRAKNDVEPFVALPGAWDPMPESEL